MVTARSEELLSLPAGGGALAGIGETFTPDVQTGTGNLSVPISLPTHREGRTAPGRTSTKGPHKNQETDHDVSTSSCEVLEYAQRRSDLYGKPQKPYKPRYAIEPSSHGHRAGVRRWRERPRCGVLRAIECVGTSAPLSRPALRTAFGGKLKPLCYHESWYSSLTPAGVDAVRFPGVV